MSVNSKGKKQMTKKVIGFHLGGVFLTPPGPCIFYFIKAILLIELLKSDESINNL